MKYLTKYKCRICAKIITGQEISEEKAMAAKIPMVAMVHESDTHRGIMDLIGYIIDDERIKAHWEREPYCLTTWPVQYPWNCSNCGHRIIGFEDVPAKHPTCPECNADMRGNPIKFAEEPDYENN